jgi:hypothetical protein
MASNPITAGFVSGMQVQIAGFTGGDTYFNNGTLSDGSLTGGIDIILVTSTQIIVGPIAHVNGVASTNGTLLQVGNSNTPCAGLSTLYTDSSLTTTTTNPLTADGLGNYAAGASIGIYYAQIYGSGITTTIRQVEVPTYSSGGSGGLSFVSSLPGTCTPGVTASVQLSVGAYTINYCSASNTWTALTAPTVGGSCGSYTSLNITFWASSSSLSCVPNIYTDAGSIMHATSFSWVTPRALYGFPYWGTVNTLSDITPPSVNGQYICGYTVTGSAAVAPTCPLVGLAQDQAAGATTLSSDNNNVIYNPSSSLAQPTPTTLGNANFFDVILFHATAPTITPSGGWTVSLNGAVAGATAAPAAYQRCSWVVDQVTSTQWDMDCNELTGHVNGVSVTGTGITTKALFTVTNCSSAASPAVCGSSPSGSVAMPTGATPTLVIDTTAVTANSQIQLTVDESLGTKLSVTCNTTLATLVNPVVTARSAGVSFTITMNSTLVTNPACISYTIIN